MPIRLQLVLGGARSGKSRFAQRLAIAVGGPVVYVATAEAGDQEMVARITRHRRERPEGWRTVELPRDLDRRLAASTADGDTVLIDCLSLWLSNELLGAGAGAGRQHDARTVEVAPAEDVETRLLAAVDRLAAWAAGRPGVTIVVTNEVGSGIVPAYPLGRRYRDLLGMANQRIAAAADAVYLVVAGVGVDLKRLAAALENGGIAEG